MLHYFYFNVVKDTAGKNNIINPRRDPIGVNSADQNEQDDHIEHIQQKRGINLSFNRDGTLMITVINVVVNSILFNAHSGTDIEKNDQCFCKQINNACEDHKSHMIGLEDMKVHKALKKCNPKHKKSNKAH